MSRLVIASSNPGKVREFAALLAPLGFDAVAQGTLDIGDAEEPHATFVENALAKARHASAASGLMALADDSGLCVRALGGRPGVRSARYADAAGSERAAQDVGNNRKLLAALAGEADRAADYVCCLVLIRGVDDAEPLIAMGRWSGTIVAEPRGANGFGYDPHFLVPGFGLTAAELDPALKNRVGHRGLALGNLIEQWRAREGSARRSP